MLNLVLIFNKKNANSTTTYPVEFHATSSLRRLPENDPLQGDTCGNSLKTAPAAKSQTLCDIFGESFIFSLALILKWLEGP